MTRITEINVQHINGNKFKVITPIIYHVGSEFSTETVVVPAGFDTDGASVPRGLWNLFPPIGDYLGAAIVHDYLYFTTGLDFIYTRKECDQIFLEAMKVLKVRWAQRKLMYRAVRMFGGKGWNRRKRERGIS